MTRRLSLAVLPDPEEPAGGYAFLELPGGTLAEAQATVAVQESFGDRWLAPEGGRPGANWQAARHEFGPYKVYRHDGADWIRIGPEIVDVMEEYTPVRIAVGDAAGEVVWPDDVLPRASGAVLGGLTPVARKTPAEAAAPAMPPPRPPVAEPDPQPEPEPDPPDPPEPVTAQAGRRGSLWLPILLAALVLGALAAWWLFAPDPEPPAPVTPEPVAQPAPLDPVAAEPDGCTAEALGGLEGGFAALAEALRACGASVSPDLALRFVEDAASDGDAAALLLFGTLYDGEELDPRIENLIGLSFADDPAQAADYYARAVAAGSEPARARLDATCARLKQADATLQKGAFDDFCR